jgi:tRNA pseudouridine38-40 synthase
MASEANPAAGESRRTLKLTLEYDGTGLAGWQRQANGPSVQEHLEAALARMLGAPTPVTGASRTDAGVHARGQVASFRADTAIPVHGLRRGLNSYLPPAIAVVDAVDAAPDFDARRSARGKHYRYQVWTGRERSPLVRLTSLHHPRPLDPEPMRQAAALLVGEHDFSAFRASGCQAKTTTRRVTGVEIRVEDGMLVFDVEGNAFLRNMVRIIVGTLLEVGQGRRDPSEMAAILASRSRPRAGVTAPAHGLTLMAVRYEPAGPVVCGD